MFSALLLIFVGFLCVAPALSGRVPALKTASEHLDPYLGALGLAVFVWGLYLLLGTIFYAGMARYALAPWLVWLFAGLVLIIIGNVLGFPLIAKYAGGAGDGFSKTSEEIAHKAAIAKFPLGIIAFLLGLWLIVTYFLYR